MNVLCYQRLSGGSHLIRTPFPAKLIGEYGMNRAVITVNGVEYHVNRAACSTEATRGGPKEVPLHDPITGAKPRDRVHKDAKKENRR